MGMPDQFIVAVSPNLVLYSEKEGVTEVIAEHSDVSKEIGKMRDLKLK